MKELPDIVDASRGREFLSELKKGMPSDHPCIVLDCSKVQHMDSAAIYLMLCCLEEAILRNGDVKLTGVSAGAKVILEQTGVSSIFESFDSKESAINSFHHSRKDVASLA
jgi:anti-anti-sigma factor